MIDLNMKKEEKHEEIPAGILIGAVIVIAAWMIWAFLIGASL